MNLAYTILRGNQQLREPQPSKTRFKAWWHLVGSALEHAAGCLVAAEAADTITIEATAEPVDFATIFRELEGEDEEAASLGDVLDALHDTWPSGYFEASELLKLVSNPMEGEEERARRVAEFFGQRVDRRYGEELTTMKVGRQLSAMVDTPIEHQGRTLKLIRKPVAGGSRRSAASYHVKLV